MENAIYRKTASFSECPFSVMIPTITYSGKSVSVRFSVRFKLEGKASLALDCGKITDTLHNVFTARPHDAAIPVKNPRAITFELATQGKSVIWTNARLVLQLLSASGTKYEICYKSDVMRNLRLESVTQQQMTEEEETRYIEIFGNADSPKTELAATNSYTPSTAAPTGPAFTSPTLDQFKNALLQEMYYLRNQGGHKYKVTNGIRIKDNRNGVPYRFELEAELNLADDAPISLTVGVNQASGSVLVCDGFELIVMLDRDFGSTVSIAYLSAEPWKLLEAQVNKLAAITQNDHLAIKLLQDGPNLATRDSFRLIPQGQETAKRKVAASDITIIWGPPGTGKTHTMAEIAIDLLKQGKKILAVSHSNVSVDGIVKKLAELMRKGGMERTLQDGKVLRYGYVRDPELAEDRETVAFNYALDRNPRLKKEREELLHEKDLLRAKAQPNNTRQLEIEKRLKDIRAEVRTQESQYVGSAQFVATTISKVTIDKLFEYRKFDVVMFDEVSMAYVPQLLCAATYATEKFVAVGDFRQLPPIAQSDAKRILEVDIFAYLHISTGTKDIYYHPWLVMLDEQRRMHPSISAFSSNYVYNALLKDHPGVLKNRREIADGQPLPGQAMGLIDLSGTYCASAKNSDNSRLNILSAIFSFSTALTAEVQGSSSVGIITPYAAQTRLIRAMLKDYSSKNETEIACSTVHQFQGSERDVIVFDAVESYPAQKVGWLMSRNENGHVTRLINVAITRARGKLITVANSQFWEKRFSGTNHTLYQLIQHLKRTTTPVNLKEERLANYLRSLYTGRNIKYFDAKSETHLPAFLKDVQNAHEKIVVSIPDGSLKKEADIVLAALKKAKADGIHIYAKTSDYAKLPQEWRAYCFGSDDAVFPLIMIDDRIIWYGLPDAVGVFHDGNDAYGTGLRTIYRITGEHTIEMIKSLTGLENRTVDRVSSSLAEKIGSERYLPQNEQRASEEDDGKGPDGLAAFVQENSKCTSCGKPMQLRKGRTGKSYLKCPACGGTAFLTPELTNWYINSANVRCPIHGCDITAKVGQYGIYIRCDRGHYLKPDEI